MAEDIYEDPAGPMPPDHQIGERHAGGAGRARADRRRRDEGRQRQRRAHRERQLHRDLFEVGQYDRSNGNGISPDYESKRYAFSTIEEVAQLPRAGVWRARPPPGRPDQCRARRGSRPRLA